MHVQVFYDDLEIR